jgi:hypothetical protein
MYRDILLAAVMGIQIVLLLLLVQYLSARDLTSSLLWPGLALARAAGYNTYEKGVVPLLVDNIIAYGSCSFLVLRVLGR